MKKIPPRQVPPRDDFYMAMALMYSSRSKDPKTQCGSFIVSKDNRPLGFGYNGPPASINDTDINWDRPDKYPFIIHAEANAIRRVKIRADMDGATIYINAKPCSACMLEIADTGISRVVYLPKKTDKDSILANNKISSETDQIALLAGVSLEVYKGNFGWLRDQMIAFEEMGIFDQPQDISRN